MLLTIGLTGIGVSGIVVAYGFFLHRLSSDSEGANEIQRRVMRGEHLGEFHLRPAYEVVGLLMSRRTRKKLYLRCGGAALFISIILVITGVLQIGVLLSLKTCWGSIINFMLITHKIGYGLGVLAVSTILVIIKSSLAPRVNQLQKDFLGFLELLGIVALGSGTLLLLSDIPRIIITGDFSHFNIFLLTIVLLLSLFFLAFILLGWLPEKIKNL